MSGSKVAIITGASDGIGEVVVQGLAEDGYKTILVARSEDKLEKVAEGIRKKVSPEISPIVIPLDVSLHEQVLHALGEILNEQGRIDVLVNNAGIWRDGTSNARAEDFDALYRVNVRGAFSVVQTVVPLMKEQQYGYIINIASRAGKYGFEDTGAYSASKFGLVGLSESLYRELLPHGIKVTALCPGWVNTKMAFEAHSPLPAEEIIQPDDILNAIRFLLHLTTATCIKEIVIECRKHII